MSVHIHIRTMYARTRMEWKEVRARKEEKIKLTKGKQTRNGERKSFSSSWKISRSAYSTCSTKCHSTFNFTWTRWRVDFSFSLFFLTINRFHRKIVVTWKSGTSFLYTVGSVRIRTCTDGNRVETSRVYCGFFLAEELVSFELKLIPMTVLLWGKRKRPRDVEEGTADLKWRSWRRKRKPVVYIWGVPCARGREL